MYAMLTRVFADQSLSITSIRLILDTTLLLIISEKVLLVFAGRQYVKMGDTGG